jgi:hypothetical protein
MRDPFQLESALGEQAQISIEDVSGHQSEGRIENIAPELTENPYEPGSARFRGIMLSVSNNEQPVSIAQTVSVKLLGCGS